MNLLALLEKSGYPVAYHHFVKSVKAPFVVYFRVDNDNVMADYKVVKNISNYRIELYTDKRDIAAEKKIEDILDSANITYSPIENYIDEEKLYQITWEVTL